MSDTLTSPAKESEDNDAPDLFTPEFKCLKARNPCPDLSGVLDLETAQISEDAVQSYPVRKVHLKPVAGLQPCEKWKAYQFINHPGLIIIQNPFLSGYQRYWVHRCLQDFPSHQDNVTNLSALGGEKGIDLWQEFVQQKSDVFSKRDPLRKLRWTTLGYHYDWTAKEYSEEAKAEFPRDVKCLTQYLAACLGFEAFQPEAAIVNYYHLDSTLAGHTDHSEIDQAAPLVSISFGQTAIFLLGGPTKAVKPMSVYLRSGDICVMSGACRLSYHAVPKILPPTSAEATLACFRLALEQGLSSSQGCDEDQTCDKYLRDSKDDRTPVSCNSDSQKNCAISSEKITNAYSTTGISDSKSSETSAVTYDECEKTLSAVTSKNQHSESKKARTFQSEYANANWDNCASCDTNQLGTSQIMHTNKVDIDSSTYPGCEELGKDIVPAAIKVDRNKRKSDTNFNVICTGIVTNDKSYDSEVDQVNSKIEEVISDLDFAPYEVYLQSSRINLNVRQVLPSGCSKLPDNHC